MKIESKIAVAFFAMVLMLSMTIQAFASGATTTLVNMHEMTCENVSEPESLTDSYGNTYNTNIQAFDARKHGFIRYELKGEYDSFTGSLVCSENTSSSANMMLSIFADGKEVYTISGFTKQMDAQNISIDLKGVNVLEFMSRDLNNEWDANEYIVNGQFTKADSPSVTYPEWTLLDSIVVVDSNNYSSDYTLCMDSYGELYHDGYGFDSRKDGYALYNLNQGYESFSGFIFPQRNADKEMSSTIKIIADGKEVFSKSGIKNTTNAIEFNIDVSNVKTLKIESSSDDGAKWDTSIYVCGTKLSKHQHEVGEGETTKKATCTEQGEMTWTCTACGTVVKTEAIPATGHTPDGKWVTESEATCGEEGEQVQHCSVCKEICDTQKVDKLPHTPAAEWEVDTEPRCDAEGLQVKKCTVCGEVCEEEAIPTVDHTYGSWEKISGSVWNNPIVKERTCSVCGDVEHVESNSTSWLKPLVIVIFVIIFGGLAVIIVTLKMNGLALEPASIKKLFSKESLTDDDIDDILNKPDDNSDNK